MNSNSTPQDDTIDLKEFSFSFSSMEADCSMYTFFLALILHLYLLKNQIYSVNGCYDLQVEGTLKELVLQPF